VTTALLGLDELDRGWVVMSGVNQKRPARLREPV